MAGNLVGPLIGGVLPPLIGIRATFLAAGAVIFVAFLATTFLIREEPRPPGRGEGARDAAAGARIPDKRPIVAMLVTGMLLMLANMSIEPIITVYVAQLVRDPAQVTLVAGLAMSAAALGSILSASRLGQARRPGRALERDRRRPAGLGAAADPAGLRHRRLAARRRCAS